MKANIAKTERFVREAAEQGRAGDPAVGAVSGAVFLHGAGRALVRDGVSKRRRIRASSRMAPLAKELGVVHPGLDLRARRAALLQLASSSSTPTASSSASIARATFPTARAIRRSTISAPAIPASRSGTPRSAASASAFAGTSGFPKPRARWRCRAREVLFYPTAIGSEPHDASLDTRDPWRRAMQGHAVSNVIPVVASNRIGTETVGGNTQSFYGSSFIADHRGDLVAELRAHRRRRAGARRSISISSIATAPPGASSATGGRSFIGEVRAGARDAPDPNRESHRSAAARCGHALRSRTRPECRARCV